MPRRIKFGEDNWKALATNENIGRVILPTSDETVKFHCKPFKLLGSKLFTKNTKKSLLHCYEYLSEMISKDRKAKNPYRHSIANSLENWIESNGLEWFDANQNGINETYLLELSTFEAETFEAFGFYNLNTETNKSTRASMRARIDKAIDNGLEDIYDLDLTIIFHFAFCHHFDVPLVVHTHHKSRKNMTTQVYNKDTTQSFIGYHKNAIPTDFGTCPYQLLAHQPSDSEICWKYDVIVADLTNLETEKQSEDKRRSGTSNDPSNTKKKTSKPAGSESNAKKKTSKAAGLVSNAKKKTSKSADPARFELSQELQKQFEETLEAENNFNKTKNTHCDLKQPDSHLLIEKQKESVNAACKKFSTLKRTLEKTLRENEFADYNQLKSKKRQNIPISFTYKRYHNTMLKCHEEFKASVEDSEKNNCQKDDIEPQAIDELKKMVDEHWGSKNPKLTTSEKKSFNIMKKKMQAQGKAVLKHWMKDDKEANELTHLRWLIDHAKLIPHYQGKFKDPESGERSKTVNLSTEWVEYHFQKSFLNSVMSLGNKQMTYPWQGLRRWVLIPREQRWMMVPLGYNYNYDSVDVKLLRREIPIKFPQDDLKSCLYTSLASAFAHMGHMKIADTLVEKMVPFIGVDAKSQWNGLEKMLREIKDEKIHVAKFNFKRGGKRLPKHKLAIEDLTDDHKNSLDVHAAALIGTDGSESHAVAVVDGLIFDSSANCAMVLSQSSLDWCCNCLRGYSKTGHAIRIKITDCTFKAAKKEQKQKKDKSFN